MRIITGVPRNQTQIYCLDSEIDQESEDSVVSSVF